ncbi:hypothetical protein CDAR_518301 [Caerostris darwini]|uniref:LAGLIDADG homing endonuclease n=1 Tax=Caerostris darwini TaxID=1538125 RepID=A0AAV4ULJ8_9ARAC|nr:hypothetical protein CDAR_518301 [Caerostris darwini]
MRNKKWHCLYRFRIEYSDNTFGTIPVNNFPEKNDVQQCILTLLSFPGRQPNASVFQAGEFIPNRLYFSARNNKYPDSIMCWRARNIVPKITRETQMKDLLPCLWMHHLSWLMYSTTV